jgi:hypothetical protein
VGRDYRYTVAAGSFTCALLTVADPPVRRDRDHGALLFNGSAPLLLLLVIGCVRVRLLQLSEQGDKESPDR